MWDATEVKVSELKGTALDWAVAFFNGECIQPIHGIGSIRFKYGFRRKNVVVMSARANRAKWNMTIEEVKKLYEYLLSRP